MTEKPDYAICHAYTTLKSQDDLKFFVQLSCELTGFNEVDLYGTGQVLTYYQIITDYLDKKDAKLATLFSGLSSTLFSSQNETYLHKLINGHGQPAKVAASLIKLWYLGQWYNPDNANDTMIPSSQSYISGLVWTAIHAHPQGAKQQGFGAWSFPPLSEDQGQA
ncbi:hypothetical protein [Parachitinimonas caeni]|uniref:Uncharacterized protein n=1 Tax=Parachitinimonas caeni TaxID=3031301 RepID=A0ABT7DWD3_9NEIS|nr:hypothetical protein [Parachitinimonas caeni]MDK2124370.1 hypothetical protein [Parachitinimonas caeni]